MLPASVDFHKRSQEFIPLRQITYLQICLVGEPLFLYSVRDIEQRERVRLGQIKQIGFIVYQPMVVI